MHAVPLLQDLAVVLCLAGASAWLCERLGLSAVAGYLFTGTLVGPYVLQWKLISDIDHLQTLSQVGLVFLMFSIGLSLNLAKIQRLGLPLICAGGLIALLLYNSSKLLGLWLGLQGPQIFFLAGILMICSSSIVSKVLHDLDATHETSGQLTLGLVLLEDIVAVLLLTLLGSIVWTDLERIAAYSNLLQTVASLIGFIVLVMVLAMLFVPRLLEKMEHSAAQEIQTILMLGILFALACLATWAGHSVALGGVILGAVVTSTKYKTQTVRAFEGLKDFFTALFFISIGMLLDIHLLGEAWALSLILASAALLVRPLAISFALLLVGRRSSEAVRAGLFLTPMGEFSFIIAQLGVSSGLLPPVYYAATIGMSFITTLIAPLWMRYSDDASKWIEQREPRFFKRWLLFYHSLLENAAARSHANIVLRFTYARLIQIAVQIIFIAAMVLSSELIHRHVRRWVDIHFLFPHAIDWFFGIFFALLLILPIVSLWRNISALALLHAEALTRGMPRSKELQPLVEFLFKILVSIGLMAFLFALLPTSFSTGWVMLALVLTLIILSLLFWRRLIKWHSSIEYELGQALTQVQTRKRSWISPLTWLRNHADWGLILHETMLPDHAQAAGKTLGQLALRSRFGTSVISIERQGFVMNAPSAETTLYPRDKILLLGQESDIQETESFFKKSDESSKESDNLFGDMVMETLEIREPMNVIGKTLKELAILKNYGVHVVGLQRGNEKKTQVRSDIQLRATDKILLLGTLAQLEELKRDWS